MTNTATTRLDKLILALASLPAISFYGAMPIVTNDRINSAWDGKLSGGPPPEHQELDPDCAVAGCGA